jgi:hypothetical protein
MEWSYLKYPRVDTFIPQRYRFHFLLLIPQLWILTKFVAGDLLHRKICFKRRSSESDQGKYKICGVVLFYTLKLEVWNASAPQKRELFLPSSISRENKIKKSIGSIEKILFWHNIGGGKIMLRCRRKMLTFFGMKCQLQRNWTLYITKIWTKMHTFLDYSQLITHCIQAKDNYVPTKLTQDLYIRKFLQEKQVSLSSPL